MRAYALFIIAATACAQEADSGFELRTTLSAVSSYSQELSLPPRDGSEVTGGFRAILYPTWKLNSHWTISGAMQIHSRPYFEEEFETQGYGVKGDASGEGTIALGQFTPAYVFRNNVIAGANSSQYPRDNFYPGSMSDIGFIAPESGDFRVSAKSRYKQLGANFDLLPKLSK